MRRSRILAAVGIFLLCPWPTRVAPAWELQAVDGAGEPVPFLLARQRWRDVTAMPEAFERTVQTNADGWVRFRPRRAWASTLERGVRVLRADPTCGYMHATVIVWDEGYSGGAPITSPASLYPGRCK